MYIGKLRHRISFEVISVAKDAYGQTGEAVREEIATPFATVWGKVEDIGGHELFSSDELHTQITTRITCRWHPGLNEGMLARVAMDQATRTFDVLSITDPDGRRRELVVECKERIA